MWRGAIAEVPKRGSKPPMPASRAAPVSRPISSPKVMEQRGHQRVDALKARIHADRLVADHSRQVQIEPAGRRRRSPSSSVQEGKPPATTTACGRFCSSCARLGAANYEARKKEAENLRARFQSCAEGLRLAMALPDVAVRDASLASRWTSGKQRREVLSNTPVDRLTARRPRRGSKPSRYARRIRRSAAIPRASASCATPYSRSVIRRFPKNT